MNLGKFLYQFHQETRKRIRELEELYKQLSKSKNAVAFNKSCLNENILPKYSNICMYICCILPPSISCFIVAVAIFEEKDFSYSGARLRWL